MSHQAFQRNYSTLSSVSKFSRAMYFEETLHRKHRNLKEENGDLQGQIHKQQEGIRHERTVIIASMDALCKSFASKLQVTDEIKLTHEMFRDEKQSHQTIQNLMGIYENIEKEARMMRRVKDNFQKLERAYNEHNQALSAMLKQSTQVHEQNQSKMNTLLRDKSKQFDSVECQIESVVAQSQRKTKEGEEMKEKIQEFRQQVPKIHQKKAALRSRIQTLTAALEEKKENAKQMNRWVELVVDKKCRIELSDQLRQRTKYLESITRENQQLQLTLSEPQ